MGGSEEGQRGEMSEGQSFLLKAARSAAVAEGQLLQPSRVRRAAAAAACMAGSWPCRSKRVQAFPPAVQEGASAPNPPHGR